MKTFIKIIAFAGFATFATACSNDAEHLAPDTLSAKNAIDAPSTGRDDMAGTRTYAVSESYYYNDDPSPESRDYYIEISTDATQPDVLTITGLSENMELQINAYSQDGNSFTFSQAFNSVEGFEGPVQINGAGSYDNKTVRIYYSLQSAVGELQAEVAGEQKDY